MINPKRIERHLIAQTDKTWSGNQACLDDKLATIQQQDAFVAIQLELLRAFGLRMKEAALLKPHSADKGAYLAVNWGTKGGRDRIVPIQTDYQREVLLRARALIKPMDSMIPKSYNFARWRNHYYYVCHANGISRKNGITSHGLRHERLNEIYQSIMGEDSPIKGGQPIANSLDYIARQEIAEVAGHSRESISKAYVG